MARTHRLRQHNLARQCAGEHWGRALVYAHSTNDGTKANWQPLPDHLIGTADLAEAFGRRFGLARAARLAGLLHDVGKYAPAFQARLDGAKQRVDHSTAGAAIVQQLARGGSFEDRITAELIAYAIAGHHAGLPDKRGGEAGAALAQRLEDFAMDPAMNVALDAAWRADLRAEAGDLLSEFKWGPTEQPTSAAEKSAAKVRSAFRIAMLGRMIFSCLVDADYKDTERFYARVENRQIDREWPALRDILPGLIRRFDRHMAGKRSADTPVNRLRAEIFDHVRARASDGSGLYTLTVPTGGGKTLASLGFALDHARIHGLDRIIYAIPFTAIIDQVAGIFRDVLGDGVILEHHSAIDDESPERPSASADTARSSEKKLKLAMEDWAAPLIVTTNVQFFESLFAARPSRCRKLHNIPRSVIILDEAQTLPRRLLVPCVRALDELARNYGCTIVLCTATQPALDQRNFAPGHQAGLPLEGRELAPDPQRLSEGLDRVTIRRAGDMNDDAIVSSLRQTDQGFVIVNSRRHALALYRAVQAAGLDGFAHLTTRQCAAHRRRILKGVRQRLKDREPCRLVATSLIEAGVDLDFPKGWRVEAGLDQIAQAAGRVNREGKRGRDDSVLTVFRSPDYPPPPEIKRLVGDMSRMLDKHDQLLSPAAMDDYFGEVYWRLDRGLDQEKILDDFKISANETDLAYRTVASKFRMIASIMEPVIVPYDDKARQAIADLSNPFVPSGKLARDLQPYVVLVPPMARRRLFDCGHAAFFEEATRGDQFAVLVTDSLYKDEVGLVWEDADYLAAEGLVI